MQTIGNMFYVVLFLSTIGSVFCVLSLFISHVLRCTLPLWFALCGMALFCVPFLSPDVVLIPPEPQHWRGGFHIACAVWLGGCAVLLVWHALRAWLAGRGLKRCRPCHDERLAALCLRCAAAAGIIKPPALYWGAPGTPICVTGALRPAVIMDRAVIEKLTDAELSAVFFHELTHIRRRHILWERLYDCVCIMNWPNPFVWIARGDFSLHCETDCDTHALRSARGQITQAQYAAAILRLLELSAAGAARPGRMPGALTFLLAKRRVQHIVARPSRLRDRALAAVLAVFVALTVAFSAQFSRQHFYPYPAYHVGTEYRTGHAA